MIQVRFTYLLFTSFLLYLDSVLSFIHHDHCSYPAFFTSLSTFTIPSSLFHASQSDYHLSVSSHDPLIDSTTDDACRVQPIGIYSNFAEYAWNRLQSVGLVDVTDLDPSIRKDSSIQKIDSSFVRIHVVSARPQNDILRYARYALLESITDHPYYNVTSSVNGTHVLNFVLFPDANLGIPIPILGIDLVTLPGGKNLCAIDFQPILPHIIFNDYLNTWPEKYISFERDLQRIHAKYVKERNITWGGDIPDSASRFFSPYALWTRFKSDPENKVIFDDIYPAFIAYVDLYIDLLLQIKQDMNRSTMKVNEDENGDEAKYVQDIIQGHQDYLRYRRERDPARPMLKKFFGEEWTETLIQTKLFPIELL